MAAYNAAGTICRALDSVLEQTMQPAQIIVVSDGSTDTTERIVSEQYGGRVVLIAQKNGGPAAARNRALAEASGDFVAFLDADDWWAPNKLERQLAALRAEPEKAVTYTGLTVVDPGTGERTEAPAPDAKVVTSRLRWENPRVPPSCVLVRTALLREIGGFGGERVRGVEDWDLLIRLAEKTSFVATPEPLTFYQSSNSGESGDADRMYAASLGLLEDTLLRPYRGARRELWRRRIVSYQAFKSMLTARGAGDREKERAYMWRSLRTWPSPFWARERFRYFLITLLRS